MFGFFGVPQIPFFYGHSSAPTALMAFGSSWAALGPAGRNALYDGGALDSSLKNALFVLEKLLSQTCACVKYWGLSWFFSFFSFFFFLLCIL